MANDVTDVLMTFIAGSKGVPAECRSTWEPSDSMRESFQLGCFFEIEDFSFSGGLEPDDSGEGGANGSSMRNTGGGTLSFSDRERKALEKDPSKVANLLAGKSKTPGKFAKYIDDPTKFKAKVDLQEISITRQIDKASPKFLDACLLQRPYSSAVIVKRKVVGGIGASNTVHLMGFLRMEFDDPLITSVEWDDGETVKEKLKFVYRGLTVIYKWQTDKGLLADAGASMTWRPKHRLANS